MKDDSQTQCHVTIQNSGDMSKIISVGFRLQRFRKKFNNLTQEEKGIYWEEVKKIDDFVGSKLPGLPKDSLGFTPLEIGKLDGIQQKRIKEFYNKRQDLIDEYLSQNQKIPKKIRNLLSENFQIINDTIQHSDSLAAFSRSRPNPKFLLFLNLVFGIAFLLLGLFILLFIESIFGMVFGWVFLIGGLLMILTGISRYFRFKRYIEKSEF